MSTTPESFHKAGLRHLLASTALAILIAGASFGAALAQTVPPADQTVPVADQADEETEAPEEIVVTGSRIKKSVFNSIAPLQVLDVQAARDFGALSVDQIFSIGSTVNNGQQIDTNVSNNFVTTNGPGTSTIDLRSLGASRTLTLINGRRLAPSGVGGAPVNADNQYGSDIIPVAGGYLAGRREFGLRLRCDRRGRQPDHR